MLSKSIIENPIDVFLYGVDYPESRQYPGRFKWFLDFLG